MALFNPLEGLDMGLTHDERAAYQAMRARGVSHEDAYEDALDGVDVDTVRQELGKVAPPDPDWDKIRAEFAEIGRRLGEALQAFNDAFKQAAKAAKDAGDDDA